jgi:iron complex transport system substrate-binding protein
MPCPQRIVSLLSSSTEILYGLGLADRVVAVSHECDFPEAVKAKPRATFTNIAVGATSGEIDRQVRELTAAGKPLYEIDVDLVVRLKPDLIVTQAQCDVCAVRYEDVVGMVGREPALRGVPIVALNPQFLHDILADVARLGEATSSTDAATRYVAELRRRIEAVRARTGNLPIDRWRRTACIEWIDPPMAAGNWMPELIDLAGGTQPFNTAGEHSSYTRWEQIVAFDPEVIVVMPCGFDLERTTAEAVRLADFPDWQSLAAVRAGRVYAVDGNALFNRSGPRIVDSLELLSRLIHPELYGLAAVCAGESPWWRRLG